MLKTIDRDRNWSKKKTLEEVYSSIATEVHAASNLHRKQQLHDIFQDYIKNYRLNRKKNMGVDPANITN